MSDQKYRGLEVGDIIKDVKGREWKWTGTKRGWQPVDFHELSPDEKASLEDNSHITW